MQGMQGVQPSFFHILLLPNWKHAIQMRKPRLRTFPALVTKEANTIPVQTQPNMFTLALHTHNFDNHADTRALSCLLPNLLP